MLKIQCWTKQTQISAMEPIFFHQDPHLKYVTWSLMIRTRRKIKQRRAQKWGEVEDIPDVSPPGRTGCTGNCSSQVLDKGGAMLKMGMRCEVPLGSRVVVVTNSGSLC